MDRRPGAGTMQASDTRLELFEVAPVDLARLRVFFPPFFFHSFSPSTRVFFSPSSLLLPRPGPQLGVGRKRQKEAS